MVTHNGLPVVRQRDRSWLLRERARRLLAVALVLLGIVGFTLGAHAVVSTLAGSPQTRTVVLHTR
jgi:hypothetical protein